MAPGRFALALVFAATVAGSVPHAQSRRAPTPDETNVMTRFIDAIASTVDRFSDENWEVESGTVPDAAAHETISIRSALPLDDCIGGDRTWTIKPDSPLFTSRLKPLYERMQTLTGAMTEKIGAGSDASA